MILKLAPACGRHRGALLALVDRAERSPATEPALAHLAACPRCEAELSTVALTIHALRRMGRANGELTPPDTAWPRLRARLERSRRMARVTAWRWRMNLGGLVTGTLIAGVLVGPLAVHISFGTTGGSEPTGYSPIELTRLNVQAEARYLSDARTGTLLSTRPETSPVTSRWRNYPDGIRLGWKEVEADEPLGNPPTAS